MPVAAPFAARTAIAQTPPTWNVRDLKQALVEFAARVTRASSRSWVKPGEGIADFDTDGVLWDEQTLCFRFGFALVQIATPASIRPESKTTQPFQAAIDRAAGARAKSGERGLREIPAASPAAITTDKRLTVDG